MKNDSHPRRMPRLLGAGFLLICCLVLLVPALYRGTSEAQEEGGKMAQSPSWEEIDRLVAEDKAQAALEMATALRGKALKADDGTAWTRALIKEIQLRLALHGYETAVRTLHEAAWPEAPLPLQPFERAAIDLFYAQTLHTYLQAYSWEINQREAVASDSPLDLKAWTRDRIATEIHQVYAALWSQRQEWDDASLGVLGAYIEQNNYPARIRGTLRDAVTYMWVELLADTSLWRPEQSNEVYRLDLARLIDGQPETSNADGEGGDEAWLADPAAHPVAKIAHLLGALETWHQEGKRPEAAFEARRERLQRLAESFTQDADQQTIRAALEAALERLGRSYPWWSQGKATLAEMVRGENAPDSLVRARAIAKAGAEAHPESIGGQRCQYIVASIEAPAYELLSMASDSAGKRSIAVQHRNLEALHFRAYALDLAATVTRSQDYNLLPSHQELPNLLRTRKPAASWRSELPATADYRMHRTFIIPPLKAPGLYVIVASVRGDFAEAPNQRSALNLILSDLVLVTRSRAGEQEVTVRSGTSGEPVAGAEVQLYRFDYRRGHQRVASEVTGADGRLRFIRTDDRRNNYFVLASHGEDGALSRLRSHYYQEPGQKTESALIYTDRSVYRPGQTLHWKVVAYEGKREKGRFAVAPDVEVQVELLDANHQVVESAEVKTNRFGSASGSFELPAGRLLGSWSLRTNRGGGQTRIEVEAYKRPTFETSIEDPAAPLRLNREAVLNGMARYYFGLPVSSGTVVWRVSREPIFPRYWYSWGWIDPGRGTPQTLAAGRAALGADGTFEVAFTPAADEREAESGVSYRYRLEADITDDGGETRSASRAFRLGFVAVEATLNPPAGFLRADMPTKLTAQRSDLNGVPRAGTAHWRVARLQQPAMAQLPAEQPEPQPRDEEKEAFETPGDRLRPRWAESLPLPQLLATWKTGAEVAQGEVSHGENGTATLALPALEPGAYRLFYETKDDFGATFETELPLVVAAETGAPLAVPAALIAEHETVSVGEKARLFAHTGLADQPFALEIFRAGEEAERRPLTAGEGGIIEIPITDADRGGLTARLTLLRDHQLIHLEERISVPWEDRELHIAFETFRDRIRPGNGESWRLVVRGADEAAVATGAAEVLAYMYDRSLDFFAPHQPPMPLGLYPTQPGPPPLGDSLGASGTVWQQSVDFGDLPPYPSLTGDRLIFLDGYGIGGPGRRGAGPFALRKMAARRPASLAAQNVVTVTSESPLLEAAEEAAAADGAAAPPEPEAPPPAAEPPSLRSDFSETAFWFPHLVTGDDGAVRIEFTVPDSVTEWKVWAHALTRDLRAGSQMRTTRSVKELLVRPYLPRFLREGDQAVLEVVVNNAGEIPLSGHLSFDIRDPESDESLLAAFGLDAAAANEVPFTVEPGGGTDLTFPVQVPARVGTVAFRVVGQAGDWSDGELRPLPVLPGRIHLAQSRFAALYDADRRSLEFADMAADDDPSRIDDQLVVTLDGQLFYSVLSALPYLVRYPYECTEQTLNRFLSTGIAASFYRDYPAVARMAEQLSARETRLETWDGADPNRKMALEETPWLVAARGGDGAPEDLINVLDPRVASAERDVALAKLRQAQTSLGGFPWWPGGPPSPHMTLYLLAGFARGIEFGVEVPRDMVVRGWSYMHRHYLDELSRQLVKDDCCWELVTYLSYVLSSYPDRSWTGEVFSDDDRRAMLDFSFRHWRQQSPLLKSYLALALQRAGRQEAARLVFDSVMDSARTTRDEGTFWAPEDRAWLWYNDTIESHAFALRTLTELAPDDPRRQGLVHWLFLNKKLNHWKSTRATAEVIYALAHYLQSEGTLGATEAATVQVGPRQERFVFEPDRYTGKNAQLRIPGAELDPATMSTVVVEKDTPGLLFASATWHFSTERLPAEARGDFFTVERRYFRRLHDGREWVLSPLEEGATLVPGDLLEVQISLRAKHAAEYVHLRDPRGAGFEPESSTSGYRYTLGLGYYEEVRDSGTNFFFDRLPVGELTFKYRLRANLAGTFKVAPATVQAMYAPEFVGYSSGAVLEIAAPTP